MNEVARIENEIDETIERQNAIAESRGMSLDEHLADLDDRRDMLFERLAEKRWLFHGCYRRA